jgi:hypothetical protein
MSEHEQEQEVETATDGAVGRLWQRPEVTFGLRAAALAGLVVTAGAAGVELSGIFDSADSVVAGPTHNTCSTGGKH